MLWKRERGAGSAMTGSLSHSAWVLRTAILLSLASLTWTFSPGLVLGPRSAGRFNARSAAPKGVRRRAAGVILSMKEGPVGRGRGAMSQEQLEAAMAQVEKNKAAPKRTPEEVRANSRVVGAGEISHSQPTLADEAYMRTKAAHSVRGTVLPSGSQDGQSRFSAKQRTEAALRGKVFVPKSEMSAADVALMKQRQQMARQVLSRNAPPTEEGLVYVPDWNENEAGKTIRTAPGLQTVGKAPEKEDMEGPGGKMKTPMEVIDMLRTMNFHVRDTFRAMTEEEEEAAAPASASASEDDEEPAPLPTLDDEEMEIMRVRLLRTHWIAFLEDRMPPGAGSEGSEVRMEMDPAKHAPHVRSDFLAEIKEALANGMPLHWPSDDECAQMALKKRLQRKGGGTERERMERQRERTGREARKVAGLANKMGQDLEQAFGPTESAAIKQRFDTLMRTYNYHPAATDIDAGLRTAIGATAILEVYLKRAEANEVPPKLNPNPYHLN
jgi:hypothetical protein